MEDVAKQLAFENACQFAATALFQNVRLGLNRTTGAQCGFSRARVELSCKEPALARAGSAIGRQRRRQARKAMPPQEPRLVRRSLG